MTGGSRQVSRSAMRGWKSKSRVERSRRFFWKAPAFRIPRTCWVVLVKVDDREVRFLTYFGLCVWDVGDKLESVSERADDEGIVIGKGSLSKIEANTSSVDNNQSWRVCS